MNQLVLTNPEGRLGLDYTPKLRYYTDSIQEIPASGSVTVYNSSAVAICTARSCTIGVTGDIMVTLKASELIDYLNKYYIELTLGLGSAAPVLVGTVTFTVNLTPLVCPVTDDDLKRIVPRIVADIWANQTTYSSQIWLAFQDVQARVRAKQENPSQIIDAAQIKMPIVWRALWYIYQDFVVDPNDKWYMRMLNADKEYNDSFNNLSLDVDEDYNKVHDETEPQDAGSVRMYC